MEISECNRLIGYAFRISGISSKFTFYKSTKENCLKLKWNNIIGELVEVDYENNNICNLINNGYWILENKYYRENKLKRILK